MKKYANTTISAGVIVVLFYSVSFVMVFVVVIYFLFIFLLNLRFRNCVYMLSPFLFILNVIL